MADDMPVTLRLKHIREAAEPRMTVRALAQELDMPSSSYAAYEDPKKFKKRYLPMEITKQIAEILAARGVDKADVLALAGLDARGAVIPQPEEIADQLDAVLVPEIDVAFSMGGGSVIEDFPIVRMVPLSRAWLSSLTSSPASQLVIGRGEGDSMMPTILDQELVIIDLSQKTIRNQDRIWALGYGGVGMIKRVRALPNGSYQINSDNPNVTPIIANDDEMITVGRVVGVIKRL